MSKISVAILDDYHGVTGRYFNPLSSRIDMTSFSDTLNANDPAQKAALIKRLQPFAVLVTMRERTNLPPDVINALPNLKLILTTGMHNAAIPLDACAARGITVVGSRGIEDPAVAGGGSGTGVAALASTTEHNWSLILGLARGVAREHVAVMGGGWQGGGGRGFTTLLAGKTLGVLGLGKLGVATARIARLAFGMRVLAWSMNITRKAADAAAVKAGLEAGAFEVAASKEQLFREADVLTIHYLLSDRSRGIVGAAELAAMKPTAYLVNTSRGPLVDEKALLSHLKAGKIRGAAMDVFDIEPLPADSEWRTTKWGEEGRAEVIISPHMGYVDEDTMLNFYEDNARCLEIWLDGKELPQIMT